MDSFYDYDFLNVKILPVLLFLLITFGCHNSAHIRTQKPLHQMKKVISISIAIPTGGTTEDHINNEYSSNSFGLGLTIGKETFFSQKSSFQIQTDLSLVNNSFSTNYRPKEKGNLSGGSKRNNCFFK
tara:strand:- start:615 stop:995 length:381 start_codon:yes stop_codon:yes gene_type:complete